VLELVACVADVVAAAELAAVGGDRV